MDVLREGSTYTTDCRFFSDSEEIHRIRWYMAPPGAKVFPGPHAFGSLVWSNDDEKPGVVGEQSRDRIFSKSQNERGYRGQCYTGQRDWFLTGMPRALAMSVPECAGCATYDVVGGLLLGGRSEQRTLDTEFGFASLALGGRGTFRPSAGLPGRAGLRIGGASYQLVTSGLIGLAGLRLGGRSVERPEDTMFGRAGLRLGGRSLGIPGYHGRGGLLLGGRMTRATYNAQMGRGGLLLGGRMASGSVGLVRQSTGPLSWTASTHTFSFPVDPLAGNTVVVKAIYSGGSTPMAGVDSEGNTLEPDTDLHGSGLGLVIYSVRLSSVTGPYTITLSSPSSRDVAVSADEINGSVSAYDFDANDGHSPMPTTGVFSVPPDGQYYAAVVTGATTTGSPLGMVAVPLAQGSTLGEGDYGVTFGGVPNSAAWTFGSSVDWMAVSALYS